MDKYNNHENGNEKEQKAGRKIEPVSFEQEAPVKPIKTRIPKNEENSGAAQQKARASFEAQKTERIATRAIKRREERESRAEEASLRDAPRPRTAAKKENPPKKAVRKENAAVMAEAPIRKRQEKKAPTPMDADVKTRKARSKVENASMLTTEEEIKKEKRQKRWNFAKPLVSVVLSLAVVVVLGFMVFNYVKKYYFMPVDPNSQEIITVEITKDDNTVGKIAEKLEKAGVIRSKTIFKYYTDFTDMSTKLSRGTFELSPAMTMDEVIHELKQTTGVGEETQITLREGLLVKDTNLQEGMGTLLRDKGIIRSTDVFLSEAADAEAYKGYWFIQEVIEKQEKSSHKRPYILEGYLFPETYRFYTSSTPDQIVVKLLDQFEKVFTQEYRDRAAELGMSVDDVIILASIIEREGKPQDFKKISAVFHRRLKIGMNLESCATHQYFMDEAKAAYTIEETKIASPYNTYINPGLPVGPICNPGKAAIEAALWPDEEFSALPDDNCYLFFCAGDPETGETLFAKTYEEHLANQAKYKDTYNQ
ncbi:MAG: endolytic transglycosylase MltG [Christensenellaceae bacterium]|jgi:UPF0755 protein